jgi:hypothetical protein
MFWGLIILILESNCVYETTYYHKIYSSLGYGVFLAQGFVCWFRCARDLCLDKGEQRFEEF